MSDRRITRLYVDHDLSRDRAPLTESETHYLGTVLRLRRGDRVLAFNGRGQERYASIASLSRTDGELELLEHVEPLPESSLALTLIQALPKTEAMDLVVQKTTELGVRALWPVTSDFSVVKLDAVRAVRRVTHWRRIARSACEQSGRHRPPDIEPVCPLSVCLDKVPAESVRIVLDPRAEAPLSSVSPPNGTAVFLLVGPEGGFSDSDLALARATGFVGVRLGPRTLRAETAAIVAVGLLQALWGDLDRG
ncbi:MAG: 16S rRNA (uracil(1498)-N(3))-methyltransferase [Gammaproteobacteria bacterium]|nr:16S rRNA (uracil(1498)-N(3))-methyltransferase [Gammaproteobacteria bacterium]